ncbi:20957_t:CDS:2, partial [Racocetra persica]
MSDQSVVTGEALSRRAYIGGLSRYITENDLKDRFGSFGVISKIDIIRDSNTVYGRVAGDSASRYLFQNLSCATANRRLGQITGQLAPYQATVSVDPASQKVNLEISWSQQKDGISQYTPAQTSQASPSQEPAPEKKAEVPREKKEYTAEEVAKHNKENDCWVIVNGEVLNVTNFLPDHPGGKKAILIYAGKDATEEFNMLHEKNVVQKYSPE